LRGGSQGEKWEGVKKKVCQTEHKGREILPAKKQHEGKGDLNVARKKKKKKKKT